MANERSWAPAVRPCEARARAGTARAATIELPSASKPGAPAYAENASRRAPPRVYGANVQEGFRVLAPRFDLGLRALAPEFAKLRDREGLRRDIVDGLALAGTLLPFSLWIAMISGAPPEAGILAAAVGSACCVLFGGTHLGLSGPSLATSVLVSKVAAEHGMGAVGAVVILASLMQLALGAVGLGRFLRLAPSSVIRGSIVGIGAFMLLVQLPAAFGVEATASMPLLERFDRIGAAVPRANLPALAMAVGSVALALGLRRISPRIPASLIAVVLAAVPASLLGLDVPRLTTGEWPALTLPALPSRNLAQLAGLAVELSITASLCTLTSTAALEKLTERRADPDQELIGNGIGGVLSGLAGGLPATQLVARSALALPLGVSTRRPALVQAIVVAIVGAAVWPVVHHVPVAALTGVVAVTALPLLDPAPLGTLLRVARFELLVAVTTALSVAAFGLVSGLQTGLALAVVGATFRLARTRALLHASSDGSSPHQVSFSGPITFLAALELERLEAELAEVEASHGLVIDLRSVVVIDGTGSEGLLRVVEGWRARGGRVALLGPSPHVRARLVAADRGGALEGSIATTAREIEPILEKSAGLLGRPHLLAGLEHFREQMREHYDSLFSQLADGQHPHTMFITCADSRISPSLLMGAHPGDIFIVRCIGALVPPASADHMPQEGAALEYGVGVLGVRHVVVCGHSKCGAISALKKGKVPSELATLGKWAEHAARIAGDLSSFEDPDEAARAVTVRQLENLKSYPLVRERIESGALEIHAWFYDLGEVEVFEWDGARGEYVVVGRQRAGEA